MKTAEEIYNEIIMSDIIDEPYTEEFDKFYIEFIKGIQKEAYDQALEDAAEKGADKTGFIDMSEKLYSDEARYEAFLRGCVFAQRKMRDNILKLKK